MQQITDHFLAIFNGGATVTQMRRKGART